MLCLEVYRPFEISLEKVPDMPPEESEDELNFTNDVDEKMEL